MAVFFWHTVPTDSVTRPASITGIAPSHMVRHIARRGPNLSCVSRSENSPQHCEIKVLRRSDAQLAVQL